MRVMIIGGTKFMGPFVVKRLKAMGHDVAAFHRGQSELASSLGADELLGDRNDFNTLKQAIDTYNPEVILDMVLFTVDQAQGLQVAAQGTAKRIVAVSGIDVYQAYGRLHNAGSSPLETSPISEESPLLSVDMPLVSSGPRMHPWPGAQRDMIRAEDALMAMSELPGTLLRLPVVYGVGDFLHRLYGDLRRMDDGRPAIIVQEDMAAWRWSRGYVENMAEAIALAVDNDHAAGKVYNVADGDALSTAEWITAIGRAAGWNGKVVTVSMELLPEEMQSHVDSEQHLVVDTSRIRTELGYQAVASIGEALARSVAWERENPPEGIGTDGFDYTIEDTLLEKFG
jgi:nucleoside-diphosphate-sugar epimerase